MGLRATASFGLEVIGAARRSGLIMPLMCHMAFCPSEEVSATAPEAVTRAPAEVAGLGQAGKPDLQIAAGLSSIFLGGIFFCGGGRRRGTSGDRFVWLGAMASWDRGQAKSIPGSVASGRRLARWAQRLGVDYATFMSHGVLPATHPGTGRSAAFWSGWKA